jgi:NADH:ubiquinone oxidoreductase subunit 6 (subunit J)
METIYFVMMLIAVLGGAVYVLFGGVVLAVAVGEAKDGRPRLLAAYAAALTALIALGGISQVGMQNLDRADTRPAPATAECGCGS